MKKLIFLILSACIVRPTPPTRDKFIARAGIYNLLVKKVHAPQWRIGYNFTTSCPAAFKGKDKELKKEITKVLQIWLRPLRELYPDKVFTDDFLFVRQADIAQCFDAREVLQQVDTRITFACQAGASVALVSGVVAPDLCIRQKRPVIGAVFRYLLAHELGHAFGLGDTYVLLPPQPSTGGLERTGGQQPASLMSALLAKVSDDDSNGIIWLYQYYHAGHPAGDCFFPDYVATKARLKTLSACEPRYPLIFEAKHGTLATVTTILHDDPHLDLNARDSGGNTALHYAVLRSSKMVQALLAQAGIKVNITNKKGRTPARLARRLKLVKRAKLIEAHPTAKLPPWSVEAHGKKAVTWGEMKRQQ